MRPRSGNAFTFRRRP